MVEVVICEKYGWTHQEFEAQPAWLIDNILAMLKAEGETKKK